MDGNKAGERIKFLREKKKLTQTELAKIVGVSAASISMYETGERKPTDVVKIKLSKALGRSVGYIFFKE